MYRYGPALFLAWMAGASVVAADGPMERHTNDRQIIDLLARVHDQGAALFNAGDHAGCYRMFQGSLVTIKLVLPTELQDHVDRGIGRAELEPVMAKRALMLHELIEEVRKKLHPTAAKAEMLPRPKPATGENAPPGDLPGVPPPGDIPKKEDHVPNRGPIFSAPEPPRAPAVPPGRTPIDAPPPVVSGVPTSGAKPTRPEPTPIEPPTEPDDAPSRPAAPAPAPKIELTPLPKFETPPPTEKTELVPEPPGSIREPKPMPPATSPTPSPAPRPDLVEPPPLPKTPLPLPDVPPLPLPETKPPAPAPSTPSAPPMPDIVVPPPPINLPPPPPPEKGNDKEKQLDPPPPINPPGQHRESA